MHLNHLDLPVDDIETAATFFCEIFAFTVAKRMNGLLILEGELGFALVLSQTITGNKTAYPEQFHIGFNVGQSDEVDRVYQQVLGWGAEIVRPVSQLGHAYTFQCLAPGDVLVEVGYHA